jgi:integrase
MPGDSRAGLVRIVAGNEVVDERCSRLLADLPPGWRGVEIGPGIAGWASLVENGRASAVNLRGLPLVLRTELAWMMHWQARDGLQVKVQVFHQITDGLRWAAGHSRPLPVSMAGFGRGEFDQLLSAWFYARYGRLPAISARERAHSCLAFALRALLARCHAGPWWELDVWAPRCDPRIPLRAREPRGAASCSPGGASVGWLGAAMKWVYGTLLQSGALTWSTIASDRIPRLLRFDRWLATLPDPAVITADLARAALEADRYYRWTSDPANRPADHSAAPAARLVNAELRAAAELMGFLAHNPHQARDVLGATPWDALSDAHPALWLRRTLPGRARGNPINPVHYVDDRALAQIAATLPVLGAHRGDPVALERPGTDPVTLPGQGDPQAMRMLLLQILTGRRASEICLCDFDCLSPTVARRGREHGQEELMLFRYGQSKIDQAPDTIMVDAEIVAVIEEQRRWVRHQHPDADPRYLFLQRHANTTGAKPYNSSSYSRTLRAFSDLVQIIDSADKPVRLSHTHRFRHTRITRLAELGLPLHVLQRYAGHTTAAMTSHYIALREEYAEQAFLAAAKYKADGTALIFSQDEHDAMHLFDRADRFLPNGYCTLPPAQSCDRGNACLTCSMFVTDASHTDALQRQLDDTTALIDRRAAEFHTRHAQTMPADNVWLTARTTECDALGRLLAATRLQPGRVLQGPGSHTRPITASIGLAPHLEHRP